MNTRLNGDRLWMQCPGCNELHCIKTDLWDWDGNEEAPTISPSILVQGGAENMRCHSFLRVGRWEFLADCTHALAGQTVDMVALPEVTP